MAAKTVKGAATTASANKVTTNDVSSATADTATATADTSNVPVTPGAQEPTTVFVFAINHWYNSISPLSKIDLLDIVPNVGVQFGFDYQSQAYLLVVTRSKWAIINPEIKNKFMMISRRIKEEMDGPMTTIQRETYEHSDLFVAFDNAKKDEEVTAELLDSIKEDDA